MMIILQLPALPNTYKHNLHSLWDSF